MTAKEGYERDSQVGDGDHCVGVRGRSGVTGRLGDVEVWPPAAVGVSAALKVWLD